MGLQNIFKRSAWAALTASCLWAAGASVPSSTAGDTAAAGADPLDWPNWRGPEQNGISRETGLITEWDRKGKGILWKRTEYGTRSTPIVMRGKLYTLCRHEPGTPREGEKVVCLDAATGETIWENHFNVYLSDVPDTRVAWSSCVGDPTTGRVYAMGVCGYMQCLEGDTGETVWSRSLSEEFGLLSTYGGRTNVPVVFEDLVITSAVMTNWGELAVPAHRFLAMDKNTGEVVWYHGTRLRPDDTTYSTPSLTVLGGQAAMVFGSGDGGVYAFQPRTGHQIWSYYFSLRGLNVSPLVAGGTVYMGQSEENRDDNTMGALCAIDASGSGDLLKNGAEKWRVKELMVGKSSPILVDGRLYAMDDANILYVVDAATGKLIGKKVRLTGTITRASPLFADGHIYACTTSAWHVLAPTEDGVKVVQRMRFPEGEEIHGSPVVSHGRIYLPTTECLYCLGAAGSAGGSTEAPESPQESPLTDMQPATVQVVPAEILIQPGEQVQYSVRLFNALGQALPAGGDVAFSVDRGGQISPQGQFAADSVPNHTGAVVTCKVGDLTGTARVRIVPPLPWKFDFDSIQLDANKQGVMEGEPPITWIGARYRHKIREMDGSQVMVKVTTIPKGTRSQSWMGQTDLHDYTIQADVKGAEKNGKMPDVGLIAQRYTLDLMGAQQQLQIRSWTSQLDRFSKSVPYAWQPNKWYTLKFRASVEDGKAVLKGKVWTRGEMEPDEWTVEAADPAPNVVGSPGLFGQANDAEIYLDNISVTAN